MGIVGERDVRRSIDNTLLKWQARLDGEAADRWLPWVIAAAQAVWLSALALGRLRSLEAGPDLATYAQAAWLIGRGDVPFLTIPGADLLEIHGSLLFYPFAVLVRPLPTTAALIVAQSVAIALGVVPLWRLARQSVRLRVGGAIVVVLAYCFHPAVHNMNLADFHPAAMALPALLAACRNGLAGRQVRFVAWLVVAVAWRADLAFVAFGLGGFVAWKGQRRVGLAVAGASLAWLGLVAAMPGLGAATGVSDAAGAAAAQPETALDVVARLFTDPAGVLNALIGQPNFEWVVYLLAPVAFLPLVTSRYLLPILPAFVIYAVVDVPDPVRRTQLVVAILPLVVVSTAHALGRMGRMSVDRVTVSSRLIGALALTTLVFFIQDAESSPYLHPWELGRRDAMDQARLEAVRDIPGDLTVRASSSMLSEIAERHGLFLLDTSGEPDAARALAESPDAIVVDGAMTEHWTRPQRDEFDGGLRFAGYEPDFDRQGVTRYVRLDGDGRSPIPEPADHPDETGDDPVEDRGADTGTGGTVDTVDAAGAG